MRLRHCGFFMGLVAVAVFAASGCGSNSTGGGGSGSSCAGLGSTGPTGVVDLAVGDDIGNGTTALVHIFLDILATQDGAVEPDPDITLDNNVTAVGSPLDSPESVVLTQGAAQDLYVASNGNNEVLVWRNYPALVSGADADVMLNNSGGTAIDTIFDMLVDANDNLILADIVTNRVLIYHDASTLTGNGTDDANVELDGTCTGFTACINGPTSIFVADGDLYVGNAALAAIGDPVVSIFRGVDAIVADEDPDAALTNDISFFGATTVVSDLIVANDVLYVATGGFTGPGGAPEVYVFQGAGSLATDSLPDAILFGAGAQLGLPSGLVVVNPGQSSDTLYVANIINNGLNGGLVGFADADNLVTGQDPTIITDPVYTTVTTGVGIQEAAGALFVFAADFLGSGLTQIVIFKNAGVNSLCTQSVPNIILSGTGTTSSDDFGPFGGVALFNGMFAIAADTGT